MKHFFYNKFFATPRFISLSAAGLDFCDHSLRFVEIESTRKGLRLRRFAEEKVPEGTVRGGKIIDTARFSKFLTEVRQKYKLHYVRVSLPEEHVYSFTTTIDNTDPDEIREAIELLLEEHIPIKATEAVFDFAVLKQEGSHLVVQVVATAEAIARSYYETFETAGLIPVSFELEAGAMARSIVPLGSDKSYLVVDCGEMKTVISIIAHNLPVYTSTIDIGGAILTQMIAKEKNISFDEAEELKKENGIAASEENEILPAVISNLSTLKDEINRRYIYWHTRANEEVKFPDIEAILLCGGGANLKGLAEYLATNLKLPVQLANPWVNMFSLDEVVPPLPFRHSMIYVTAIGLALGDYEYD